VTGATTVTTEGVFVVLFKVIQSEPWFGPGVGEYRLILHSKEMRGVHGQTTLQRYDWSPARDKVWSCVQVTPEVVFVVVQALLRTLPEHQDIAVTGERPSVFTVNLGDLLVTHHA
jgi:hypothetical protein